MESIRRPSVLAALAAAVLVVNVVVLAVVGGSDDDASDPAAAPGTEETAAGAGQADSDEDTAADGEQGTQQGAGDTTDGDAGGEQGDAGEEAADGGSDDADSGQAAEDGGLGVPAAGTYAYASSGTWSLSGGEQSEEHELPATATGTLQVDGDAWQLRLAAGDRYADRLGFTLGADGGLDWTTWVLERQFGEESTETSYSCSGDSAYYRPDEQGRVVEHDCESDAGISSDGQVEHIGSEDVTLGDGSVVTADRLLYTYTVSGSGSNFEVTGEGRLDLWMDPTTGLRLREQRSISTTTSFTTGGEQVYREDVEFTLQSTAPS